MIEGGTVRWSVAQIWSKRGPKIRDEIEGANRGTFTPTFARRWLSGGKPSSHESALLAGYMFVEATGEPIRDSMGREIEGVIRLLPGIVREDEARMMTMGHVLRTTDETAPVIIHQEQKAQRRKPRRSLRLKRRLAIQEAA